MGVIVDDSVSEERHKELCKRDIIGEPQMDKEEHIELIEASLVKDPPEGCTIEEVTVMDKGVKIRVYEAPTQFLVDAEGKILTGPLVISKQRVREAIMRCWEPCVMTSVEEDEAVEIAKNNIKRELGL